MPESDSIAELQIKLTQLERHIETQDAEIYRLSKRVEAIVSVVERQKLRLESLAAGGVSDGSTMPADEKPPHY